MRGFVRLERTFSWGCVDISWFGPSGVRNSSMIPLCCWIHFFFSLGHSFITTDWWNQAETRIHQVHLGQSGVTRIPLKTMLKVLVAAADAYRLQTYFAHLFPTTDLGWIGAWGWRFCQRPPQMYPCGGFFTVIHRIGVEPPTNSIQGKSVVHEVSPIGYPNYQWRNYTPWNEHSTWK